MSTAHRRVETLLISDNRGRVNLAPLAHGNGAPIGRGRREWLATVDPSGVITLTPARVLPMAGEDPH
jgi:hypothetical protein